MATEMTIGMTTRTAIAMAIYIAERGRRTRPRANTSRRTRPNVPTSRPNTNQTQRVLERALPDALSQNAR
eukprot:11181335-Lingulodinium_polyedra.AAC.1